jgi:ribose-phosphate pyrophosphokinase
MIKLNGKEVMFGRFPNGELYLQLEGLCILEENKVVFRYRDNECFLKLGMLQHQIRTDRGATNLYIMYLPYSRMDRSNGIYACSLKYVAKLINDMGFAKVTIREPHSKESLDSIMKSEADWWVANRLEDTADEIGGPLLYFPDKGARDRYDIKSLEEGGFCTAYGKKQREFRTGGITGYEVVCNFDGAIDRNVLIVDDLCSRGGTFVAAAKLLKERGAKHISLLVAHCEYNVLNGELFDYIDRLYCSDSIIDKSIHPRITIL